MKYFGDVTNTTLDCFYRLNSLSLCSGVVPDVPMFLDKAKHIPTLRKNYRPDFQRPRDVYWHNLSSAWRAPGGIDDVADRLATINHVSATARSDTVVVVSNTKSSFDYINNITHGFNVLTGTYRMYSSKGIPNQHLNTSAFTNLNRNIHNNMGRTRTDAPDYGVYPFKITNNLSEFYVNVVPTVFEIPLTETSFNNDLNLFSSGTNYFTKLLSFNEDGTKLYMELYVVSLNTPFPRYSTQLICFNLGKPYSVLSYTGVKTVKSIGMSNNTATNNTILPNYNTGNTSNVLYHYMDSGNYVNWSNHTNARFRYIAKLAEPFDITTADLGNIITLDSNVLYNTTAGGNLSNQFEDAVTGLSYIGLGTSAFSNLCFLDTNNRNKFFRTHDFYSKHISGMGFINIVESLPSNALHEGLTQEQIVQNIERQYINKLVDDNSTNNPNPQLFITDYISRTVFASSWFTYNHPGINKSSFNLRHSAYYSYERHVENTVVSFKNSLTAQGWMHFVPTKTDTGTALVWDGTTLSELVTTGGTITHFVAEFIGKNGDVSYVIGTVTATGGGGDVELTNTTLVVEDVVEVDNIVINLPDMHHLFYETFAPVA